MVPQAEKSAAPPVIPSPPSGPSATHPPVYPSAEPADTARQRPKLGSRIPPWGSWIWQQKGKHPIFLPVPLGAKHPRYWRVILVVYQPQLLSGHPGNSWKAQQHPALARSFRVAPEEEAQLPEVGPAEPAAFPPRVHVERACTARVASRGWHVPRRPRCPLARMPAGQ